MTYNQKLENSFIIVVLLVACIIFLYDVELYGDIFQFLALYLGVFILLYERNIKRIVVLCIAAFCVLFVVYAIKGGFVWLASYNADYAQISLRPYAFSREHNVKYYNGFPSGHTAGAFIAVGFAMRYYSKKWVAFLALLALFVPPSRVITMWHTTLQVVAGGIFSLFITYGVVYALQKCSYFRNA